MTPMKKKLQILMIGVTLFSVISGMAGRSQYLHRMAVFHENESMRLEAKQHNTMREGVPDVIAASQHWELARRYREGVWRPWARVDTKLIELPVSDMETWAEQVDKQRAGKLKPKP